MQENADVRELSGAIVDAVQEVFTSRFGALYVYGSGVDGSFIPDFSDLDLAVFCQGRPSWRTRSLCTDTSGP